MRYLCTTNLPRGDFDRLLFSFSLSFFTAAVTRYLDRNHTVNTVGERKVSGIERDNNPTAAGWKGKRKLIDRSL